MLRLLLAVGLIAAPAAAEVAVSDTGFATSNAATVAAPPEEVWTALVAPARWWNPAHSYSGEAVNFSLDPRPGGCFCETVGERGGVEHMRVVLAMPARTLRLAGALGPLQGEGVAGAMTWELEPVEGGTRIVQSYVVGGHMRFETATIAPLVDGVVGEQLERLAALFPPLGD